MREGQESLVLVQKKRAGGAQPCGICGEDRAPWATLCETCGDLAQRLGASGDLIDPPYRDPRRARITITYRHLRPSSRLTHLLERHAEHTLRQIPGAAKLSLVFDRIAGRGFWVETSLKLKGAFVETRAHAHDDSDTALAVAARRALQDLAARAHELQRMQRSRLRGWLQEITGLVGSEG